jgi:archaellin
MPDDIEVETDKLREQVDEAREEASRERGPAWLRYVGLGAAIFAVVAAVAALRSGDLINEALIAQIKASDTWNEYQAARQKEHIYTVAANNIADNASKNAPRLRTYRAEIAKEVAKEERRHHAFEYAVALLQVAIALGAVAALARSKPAWYVSLAAGVVGIVFFVRGFSP